MRIEEPAGWLVSHSHSPDAGGMADQNFWWVDNRSRQYCHCLCVKTLTLHIYWAPTAEVQKQALLSAM